MKRISLVLPLRAALATVFLALAGLAIAPDVATAQSAKPAPNSDGATPAVPPPVPVAPSPNAGEAAPGDTATEGVQRLTYPLRPTAALSGNGNWDNGFQTLLEAFGRIRAAMKTAALEPSGRPIAVFLETDDEGFRYDAMIPLAAAPPGGVQMSEGVRIATTPTGEALKFQHRGAYDDIDSTYEAITAYLDEKGLNAANIFIEEYLNDAQNADDNDLALDIYVFVK